LKIRRDVALEDAEAALHDSGDGDSRR